MEWYLLFAVAAFAVCIASLLYHLIKIVSLGNPTDLSSAKGNPKSAMPYAFIGAMSPKKKESAFLYLPTYSAGIVYHIGTFSAFIFFFLIIFRVNLSPVLSIILSGLFTISGLC